MEPQPQLARAVPVMWESSDANRQKLRARTDAFWDIATALTEMTTPLESNWLVDECHTPRSKKDLAAKFTKVLYLMPKFVMVGVIENSLARSCAQDERIGSFIRTYIESLPASGAEFSPHIYHLSYTNRRTGEHITIRDTRETLDHMEKYARTHPFARLKDGPLHTWYHGVFRPVLERDDKARRQGESGKLVDNESQYLRTMTFITMAGDRCDAAAEDGNNDKPLPHGFSYVGYADNFQARATNHRDYETSKLMTLFRICAHIVDKDKDYSYELFAVPIIPIFKGGQAEAAEITGTMLAGGYATEGTGFVADWPGKSVGNAKKHGSREFENHVKRLDESWLKQLLLNGESIRKEWTKLRKTKLSLEVNMELSTARQEQFDRVKQLTTDFVEAVPKLLDEIDTLTSDLQRLLATEEDRRSELNKFEMSERTKELYAEMGELGIERPSGYHAGMALLEENGFLKFRPTPEQLEQAASSQGTAKRRIEAARTHDQNHELDAQPR